MTKIKNLCVNGCSYMKAYDAGPGFGHQALAEQLGIATAETLSIGGSCNSRILRTTLKHSYLVAKEPTLYVLGMTFIGRGELPISRVCDDRPSGPGSVFEGPWLNPQNQGYSDDWDVHWDAQLSNKWNKLRVVSEQFTLSWRMEDLMYQMLGAIADLKSRGHQVIMYQQADFTVLDHIDEPMLAPFASTPNIVDGFRWLAVPYQLTNDVPPMGYTVAPNIIGLKDSHKVPAHIAHPANGHHQVLNDFLVEYITRHNLLDTL
jgi:hypothetical protein